MRWGVAELRRRGRFSAGVPPSSSVGIADAAWMPGYGRPEADVNIANAHVLTARFHAKPYGFGRVRN